MDSTRSKARKCEATKSRAERAEGEVERGTRHKMPKSRAEGAATTYKESTTEASVRFFTTRKRGSAERKRPKRSFRDFGGMRATRHRRVKNREFKIKMVVGDGTSRRFHPSSKFSCKQLISNRKCRIWLVLLLPKLPPSNGNFCHFKPRLW